MYQDDKIIAYLGTHEQDNEIFVFLNSNDINPGVYQDDDIIPCLGTHEQDNKIFVSLNSNDINPGVYQDDELTSCLGTYEQDDETISVSWNSSFVVHKQNDKQTPYPGICQGDNSTPGFVPFGQNLWKILLFQ
jgi:hypothetical protein